MTIPELIKELQEVTNQNKVICVPEDEYYGKLKEIHKVTEYADKVVLE